MSGSRIVFLVIVPALIATVVPILAATFDLTHASPSATRILFGSALVFIAPYAVGAAVLARMDHRRIVSRIMERNG